MSLNGSMLGRATLRRCVELFGQRKVSCPLKKKPKVFAAPLSTDVTSAVSSPEDKWVFVSPNSDVIIPEGVSFTQYVFDKQEEFAEKTALVNGETGQSFTHLETRILSLRLASALSRLEYSQHETVAIVCHNCPEFVICFMGLSTIGAVPSPINFSSTAEEIRYQLENGDCTGVMCHEDKVAVVREACKDNERIRHIISIGPEEDGVLSFYKLIKDDGKGLPISIKLNHREDVAVLPYSSGTTGLPKGVMLTHRNLVANIEQMMHSNLGFMSEMEGNSQHVVIGVLPMYHIYGMIVNMTGALVRGAKYVTLKEFNQHSYIDAVKKYKATILPIVPPLMSFFESSSLVSPKLLDTVDSIVCGAAPLGEALIERFLRKFGRNIKLFEGYGMTETSPVTHATPANGYVIGSCGAAISNTFTKIVDVDTGDLIGPNEGEGELCVKGPQVMKGYFKNEKATHETISEDGWLHTGDIAKIDENLNVFITDRLKELIKVKGMQVAPAELENVLRNHPGVKDVAIVGVPDERAGELPKAFVVPSESQKKASEEELKNFVALRVSAYKQLKSVEFVEEIPKSAAGKILRKLLRK